MRNVDLCVTTFEIYIYLLKRYLFKLLKNRKMRFWFRFVLFFGIDLKTSFNLNKAHLSKVVCALREHW